MRKYEEGSAVVGDGNGGVDEDRIDGMGTGNDV